VKEVEIVNDDLKRKRKNSVRTALVLGVIALAIFATFVGSAVLSR
jgi:hypothetical protein